MYAKIKSNQIVQFPYSFTELQADNPYTNYGSNTDFVSIFPDTEEAVLRGHTLVEVTDAPVPDHNARTHRAEAQPPVFANGAWVREWLIVAKTAEELAQQDAAQATSVRNQRDQLLKDTDWHVIKALDSNQPQDPNWVAYRQALRDVPSQTGFPWEVQWPTKPE